MEIFTYEFMQRAFIVGLIIGLIAPILGTVIVLKRYSMLTDALAHISILGVAIAILIEFSPIWVAIIVVILSALSIELLRDYLKIYSDSLLSMFLSGALSLAIILISLTDSFNTSLLNYLFGSILTISENDLIIILTLGTVIFIFSVLFLHKIIFTTFDEDVAKVNGINIRFYNFMFLVLVSILITISIKVIGSLLIGALIIIPVISAFQFNKSLIFTIFMAITFSLLSIFMGLIISYNFGLPSGTVIVLNAIFIFILSALLNKTSLKA
jgi:zinc transport system permease protein